MSLHSKLRTVITKIF